MSIHRAFLLAAIAWVGVPLSALGGDPAGPDAAAPAEYGEAVPDPAGRGFPIGSTGLTLGGYLTGEAEDLRGEDHYSDFGGNLFLFYEPARYFRLFADLELALDEVALERGYAELPFDDALNLRLGKLLTPIGRWNQAHIEPLTWTTSEPAMIESVFDDTVSGFSLQGSVFPGDGALSYAAYASLVDPIEVDADEGFADRSAGLRVEWASLGGWTAGLSYYASQPPRSRWHHLGGADLLWQPNRRVEVSAEALAGEGTRAPGAVQALYAQAAIETFDHVHLVVRLEHFALPGSLPVARFAVAGTAWAPRPWLRLKADYMWSNEAGEFAEPGARASLSVLF